MDIGQIRWSTPTTNVTPDSGGRRSASSTKIRPAGSCMSAAGVSAKQGLRGSRCHASSVFRPGNLTVSEGGCGLRRRQDRHVRRGYRRRSFSAPMGGSLPPQPGSAGEDYRAARTVSAGRARPIDIPDKVTGQFTYVANVRVPVWHAARRVIRPRGQANYGTDGDGPLSLTRSSIAPPRRRRGLAKEEETSSRSSRRTSTTRSRPPRSSRSNGTTRQSRDGNMVTLVRAAQVQTADARQRVRAATSPAFGSAAKVLSATYSFGYNMHGPIGPSAAVADVTPSNALSSRNTQGTTACADAPVVARGCRSRQSVCSTSRARAPSVTAPPTARRPGCGAHVTGAGGKPVRLQFMRWDEHGWDAYGPSSLEDIRAGVDANGKIVVATTRGSPRGRRSGTKIGGDDDESSAGIQARSRPSATRPESSALDGVHAVHDSSRRRQACSVSERRLLEDGAASASASSPNDFAVEATIDEDGECRRHGPDRLPHPELRSTAHERRVLTLLGLSSRNWETTVPASNVSRGHGRPPRSRHGARQARGGRGRHRGRHEDRYIREVLHLTGVQDVGLAISPGLVENQMSGSLVQTVSRSLEAVRYTKSRVTSLDFVTYPILRFKEAPKVTTVVLQRTDQVSSGAGEPLVPGTPPALANAFFDATGVRLRQAPLTPPRARGAEGRGRRLTG